jgi:hypothetical protein
MYCKKVTQKLSDLAAEKKAPWLQSSGKVTDLAL